MLLAAVLIVFAIGWAFWLCYIICYPSQWAARVARHRRLLLSFGIDLPWMHRIEKGPAMKVLVALITIITLTCVVILLNHPTAWQDFWRAFNWWQS
jgi:hypothetical protein